MFRAWFWLAALMAFAGVARAAPLESYGKLPNIEAVAVGPDGTAVAIVLTDGVARKLLIEGTADHKVVEAFSLGAAKVRDVQWAGPQHLIVTTSQTAVLREVIAPRGEFMLAFDLNLATHRLRGLLEDAEYALNVVATLPQVWVSDGKPVVFLQGVRFVESKGTQALYRIDLDRDASHLLETGFRDTIDFQVGPDGRAIAQTTYDDRSSKWALKLRDGLAWRDSHEQRNDAPPTLLGLGRNGKSVLMQEFRDGILALREVGPDGVWGEPLAIQDDDAPIFDPESHALIGYYALVGDEDRYTFFDPHDQQVWNAVAKAYSGARVRLVSWSNARKMIAVLVDSPNEAPAYALVDMDTHRGKWLGPQYDKLATTDIASVRPIKFKAKDGLELTGYLTTPRDRMPKGLPLVVFPHGGPAARDTLKFDWWAQAMASRGYAVLQVNFRGSDGYGWKFLEAGFGEWGRKMQTDLSDGVRYLAAEGVIDPTRVCIVGGSYGGYAALAGAALDTGVYRCAVSYGGISDLRKFNNWISINRGYAAQRYLLRFMGAESTRDPGLHAVSPIAHIGNISIPVLLVHGKDDTVVPLEQSRIMADALKAANKPVQFVTLNSTDHWLTNGETRLAMLRATMAFVEKNNPPTPP
jgi:dipeptidyl aminopeptidase/acylaminoacyl peptidase